MNPWTMLTKALSTDGEIRFGALASFIALIFCLGWDTAYVVFVWKHWDALHMTVGDFLPAASTLLGQTAFFGYFYTANKTQDYFKDKNQPPQQ